MNTIRQLIVLAVLCLILTPGTLSAQCEIPEEVRIKSIHLDEGTPSGAGGYIELETMPIEGSSANTVDLRNFIIDDNNEARYGVGTSPGHLVFGECFKDLPIGTKIIIYDDNNLHPGISPSDDGWSGDGKTYQIPFSDACLLKLESCPNYHNSAYCKEAPAETQWEDILSFRLEGDVVQVRNRKTELVQAVKWGRSQFSDGGGEETYSLDDGQCEFLGDAIVVTYAVPLSIEVSIDRLTNDLEYEVEVQIEGGLAPYHIVTNQGYTFSTSQTFHSFTTTAYDSDLIVSVSAENGCSDDDEVKVPKVIREEIEICKGGELEIGIPTEDLPRGIGCTAWSQTTALESPFSSKTKVETENLNGTNVYTLYVTDQQGNLVAEYEYVITIKEMEVLISGGVESLCLRGAEPQKLVAEVPGELAENLTYLWSNGATTQSIMAQPNVNYTVTVHQLETGCQGTAAVDWKEAPLSGVYYNPDPLPTLCPGENLDLAVIAYEEGSPIDLETLEGRYYIHWSNGDNNRENLMEDEDDANLNYLDNSIFYGPGDYYVMVEDLQHGCSFVEEFEIEGHELDYPSYTPLLYSCNGESVSLGVDQSYSNYAWSTGESSATISTNIPGTYALTVTEGDCSFENIEFELIDGTIDLSLESIPGFFCEPGKVVIRPIHSSEDVTYLWSSGETYSEIEVEPQGVYSLTVTDLVSNCTASAEIEITGPTEDLSEIVLQPGELIYCAGLGEYLSLETIPDWVENLTWIKPDASEVVADQLLIEEAGDYSLEILGESGCTYVYPNPIEVKSGLEVSIGPSTDSETILCSTNDPNEVSLMASVEGGTGILAYNWSVPGESTSVVTVSEVEFYSVTVTDERACTGEAVSAPAACMEDDVCMNLSACAFAGYSFGDMREIPEKTSPVPGSMIIDFTGTKEPENKDTYDIMEDAILQGVPSNMRTGIIISSSDPVIPVDVAQAYFNNTPRGRYHLLLWIHYDHETGEAGLCLKMSDDIFGDIPQPSLVYVQQEEDFSIEQKQELKASMVAWMKRMFACDDFSDFQTAAIERFSFNDYAGPIARGGSNECGRVNCAPCIINCNENWRKPSYYGIRKQGVSDIYLSVTNVLTGKFNFLREIKKKRTIPEEIWKLDATTIFYIDPFNAGIIDAILNDNIFSAVYDMIKLMTTEEFFGILTKITNPIGQYELAKQIVVEAPNLWAKLVEGAQKYSSRLCGEEGCDVMRHAHGRLVGGIGMFVLDLFIGSHGTALAAKLAREGFEGLTKTIFKWTDELANLSDATKQVFMRQANRTFTGCATGLATGVSDEVAMLRALLDDPCGEFKKFIRTIYGEYGSATRKKIAEHPSLMDVWKKYNKDTGAQMPEELLNRFPNKADDFYDEFENLFFKDNKDGTFSVKEPDNDLDDFLEAMSKDGSEGKKLAEILVKENGSGIRAWKEALDGGLVHMRVKTDFLETVSHYTRTNNPVARAFSNNMSLAEEAMIRHYTTGAHDALNSALKSSGNLSDDLLEFKNTLTTALNELPDHVGVVHRGLDELNSIAAEFWAVGQKIQRPAFVSSSTSVSVAETFMNLRGGHVVLKIESKTGKLIKDAAVDPKELEVLFKSGKEFEVTKAATPKPGNPSILEVSLKEL